LIQSIMDIIESVSVLQACYFLLSQPCHLTILSVYFRNFNENEIIRDICCQFVKSDRVKRVRPG